MNDVNASQMRDDVGDFLRTPFPGITLGSENPVPPSFDQDSLRQFVKHLNEKSVHPVLVFGTGGSGKTMMLHSLIAYARAEPDAHLHVSLGEPVFPKSFRDHGQRYLEAQKFFNQENVAFISKREIPRFSNRNTPFFIPIEAVAGERQVTFAFLEGSGDWYHRGEDAAEYQDFKAEIASILELFQSGLSVIFVAPVMSNDIYPGEVGDVSFSSECMGAVIEQYGRLRFGKARDRALLLLSKWDQFVDPAADLAEFASPGPDTLMARLAELQFVWPAFAGLKGLEPGARSLTPYAAAYVREGGMQDLSRYKKYFDRYNRGLWNWLFEGARSNGCLKGGKGTDGPLYPDVALTTPKASLDLSGLLGTFANVSDSDFPVETVE